MKPEDKKHLLKSVESAYTILLNARREATKPLGVWDLSEDDLEYLHSDLTRALACVNAGLDSITEEEDDDG